MYPVEVVLGPLGVLLDQMEVVLDPIHVVLDPVKVVLGQLGWCWTKWRSQSCSLLSGITALNAWLTRLLLFSALAVEDFP